MALIAERHCRLSRADGLDPGPSPWPVGGPWSAQRPSRSTCCWAMRENQLFHDALFFTNTGQTCATAAPKKLLCHASAGHSKARFLQRCPGTVVSAGEVRPLEDRPGSFPPCCSDGPMASAKTPGSTVDVSELQLRSQSHRGDANQLSLAASQVRRGPCHRHRGLSSPQGRPHPVVLLLLSTYKTGAHRCPRELNSILTHSLIPSRRPAPFSYSCNCIASRAGLDSANIPLLLAVQTPRSDRPSRVKNVRPRHPQAHRHELRRSIRSGGLSNPQVASGGQVR